MMDADLPQDDESMLDLGHFLRERFPDDAPREPGRAGVRMGGEPRIRAGEVECDYCGRRLRFNGVAFGDPLECPRHPDMDCLSIHIHYGTDCPALRWRLQRIKTAITWPVERRWKSWRWRRHANAERNDPEAWAHFWSDESGGDGPC